MAHKKNIDIHEYLNFELSSDEERAFKNSDAYQKNKHVLDILENTKAIPFDATALLMNINSKKVSETRVIPLYKKWWAVSVAASILICCSLLFMYSIKPISYHTEIAESIQFSLPDESTVWLNAKSEISHNKDWKNSRDIQLNGEAYFEVAKGKKFTVKTPQGTVTVLGTKFNVKQRNEFFEVHCFEGSVAVTHNQTKTVLKPNEVFTSKKEKTQINTITKPNWVAKKSVFYNTDLNSVLKDISLHYNIKFKENKNIDYWSLKYTGSYQYSDDLNVVLDVLCKSLHLNYTIKSKTIYLSIKE